MAERERAEAHQEVEDPEDEIDASEAALLHIGRYTEARRALPWVQWTFREKASYYMDRMFLGFLILFFVIMIGEFSYKMWYITNLKKIAAFFSGIVVWLFGWLLPQEGQEDVRGL